MSEPGMVIVGAGEAGTTAALTLREGGWHGAITLIGEEPHAPYERPPLSKAVMTGDGPPALPAAGYAAGLAERGIDHLTGTLVTGIDRAAKSVMLGDGRCIIYARLLLATGASARRLAVPGGEHALVLRSFADAVALKPFLAPGKRLAVIGGGFIGLEFAASARERGADVTVVEAAPRILMRGVPERIAAIIAARHGTAGVDLRTGIGIERIEAPGEVRTVVLASGERLEADAVVAGIGVVPETKLAEAAGLAIANGIAVDATLRTSDPDIFAAGDCCAFPCALHGGVRIRLEAWRNALDQGAHAARAMLGATEPHTALPWFWSDQYDLHLQSAGLAPPDAREVWRDLGDGACLCFHLDGEGRLIAASGVGPIGKVAKEVRMAEMLIARHAHPDPDALASPAVRLKSLLAG